MANIEKCFNAYGRSGEFYKALAGLYRIRGINVTANRILAWAYSGELYLSYCLCGLDSAVMRAQQYEIREIHGPIILGCEDYATLYRLIAGTEDAVGAVMHIQDADGTLHETWVDRQLVIDMFDFCRDGIG